MRRRPYRGPADVALLQRFTARAIESDGRVGMMHPGDIPHRIFSALRGDDPYELVHIWEKDPANHGPGEVVAWTLLDPRGAGHDPQISPSARRLLPHLERTVNAWSEDRLLELMRRRGSRAAYIETDAFADDGKRTELLESTGWIAQEEQIMLSRRRVQDVVPPNLPDGYRLRSVVGVSEAGPVAELHSAAFESSWTPELYRRVMESPGYDPGRELLVEAANGALAGFCVIWPDDINRTGLFEPVGVHPDHQRRGLARALLRGGLVMMHRWGMELAEVMYECDNPGSGPLYRGEGFVPAWELTLYRKPVPR